MDDQKLVAASLGQADRRDEREQRMISTGSDIQMVHHLPDDVVRNGHKLVKSLYEDEVFPYKHIEDVIASKS